MEKPEKPRLEATIIIMNPPARDADETQTDDSRCPRNPNHAPGVNPMNHTYKTLYNTALGAWVAVPETARNHGKSKSVKVAAVTLAVAGALFSSPVQAAGLPWGSGANAPGNESIAMGNGSDAKTNYTIALGTNAKNTTNGEAGIIIGSGAKAITDVNPNTAVNTMGQQVVIGEASEANSQSVALGAQVYASGQSSIAIGGDDLGNNDSKTSAGKYGNWRDYAGQPITVEGVSTKDASNPAIGFTSTTASGRGSIAVGHMGQSTGKASVAIGADSHAEADGAIATGMASQAKGVASVATGIGATAGARGAIATGLKAAATGTDAVATGTGARAGARNDVAIGHDAGAVSGAATTGERVMIGANATVGANQNLNVAAGGTFGSINLTTKTANQSVAIGGGSGEDAERRTYAYGDQSLAIGSDTLAYGDGSVAIGGDDLNSAGSQQTTYTDSSGQQKTDTVRNAYNALTGDTMNSGVYVKTASKQAAVAIGVQAQASDLGVAIGSKSAAAKTNSVAIGTGAQATLDNAVAIGGGSKTLDAGTKQESTTINGVTYNWAGGGKTLPGDIVSFGSEGYERQLKHVAAGEVSATSTDAINGSQLYAVAAATSYLANGDSPVVRTNAAGEPLKKARDGKYYKAGDVNADGSPKAGATAQTPVALSLTHHDGTATPTTLHNVAAGTADTDAVNVSQIYNYAHVNDGTGTQGAGIATSNRAKVNEKGGATGDYAIAVGVKTKAEGESSTAAGYGAQAKTAGDIALGHKATAAGRSTATGTITAGNVSNETYGPAMAQGAFANAQGRNAIAIGNNAQAKGDAAGAVNDVIAIGGNSVASGNRAVVVGYKANAGKAGTVAIGESAGNTNSETAVFIGKSAGSGNTSATGNTHGIAIGNGAGTGMKGGTENVAIGTSAGTAVNGNTNYAIGSRAGQNVTGSDNYAMGINAGKTVTGSQNSTFGYHSGTNITGSSNSAFGRDAGKNIVGSQNLAFGAHAGQNVGVTGTAAHDNIAIGTNANKFAAGSELTTSGNTAIGKNSTAKGGSSVALGDAATADKANAVALGANSNTDAAATRVTQATVGSITYSGFAGGTNIAAGDQVSVGKTDSERQIKHVAPGKISATSTDAINGSQLYAVAEKTQTHYYSVKSTETGTDSNYANDGATGSNSLAAGAKAKASAMNTVAVGYNAQATNDSAVAVGANTEATNASTALGDSSKAKGKNSTALGWNANAVGEADVFIGKQAGGNTMNVGNSRNIGIGEGAISNVGNTKVSNIIGIGTGAAAGMQGDHNIALGAYANGTDNGVAAVTTTNNVAIGERTRASGGNAIAIGARGTKAEGLAAIALGVGADAKGQNGVAAGQNTVASASGTVAIGGSANPGNGATASGVQAVAIGQLSKASGNKTTALGAEANASGLNSTALGTGASTAGGLGGLNAVAVGAKASANAGSTTAVGAAAQASGVNAAAFGAGAQAGTKGTAVGYNAVVTHNGAVALGADSVSTATFGAVPNATINGITYGNFAAANVNATVSVGSAGNERAITNVGAGRINANSTDAINGSQLYAITNQLQAGQTHYYSVNDGGTRGSNYNNDGARGKNSLAAGANARAGSSNSVAMGDGADTGNGVNSNIKGLNTAIGSNAKIGANGKISWEATAIGADTVAEGVRTTAVGYGASATEYYATAIGYKSTAPEWHALAIGSQATVAPTASTDVAAAQAITTNLTNVSDASKSAAAVAIGRQATAGGYGAIAQGLNTQATTAYATAVGANAKASKVGSTAFGAYASAEADSSVALGRYSHADREKLAGTATLGADPLGVGAQAGTLTWQSNAGAVSVGSSSNRNYAGVNVPATTRQIINLAAGSADTDAVNVAQLKAAGFNLAVSQSGGTATDETPATATGADDKKIANGETFTLDAGSGISLKQKGGKITVATDAQAITDNAQLPVVYTKADGSKVYKRGNKFYDAPVGGNEVAAADVIASMQNAAGSTTAPTVLANVASNLADASSVTSNPANNARGDFANKGNNAATVNDVLNAGFNVQGNGDPKDFVTHGDTINFANGRGTTANVSSSNGTTTVKFDTPLEYTDASGNASTTPTNTVKLVGGDASQPVALQNVAAGTNDTDAVNVSQLNAVKTTANKGFKIAGNSKANGITMDNETIKPDETLTVKGTGTGTFATDYNSDNIQTQVSGDGTITIGLKKDIAVNSVTATDGTNTTVTRPTGTVTSDGTGNTTATTANGVKATDTNGNTTSLTQTGITTTDSAGNTTAVNSGGVTISKPGKNVVSLTGDGLNNGGNKITNVAKGEADTDAVNVSQLNAAAKAAKTEVKSADGSVTVTANTPTPGNPTVYDLSVNTDGTTITKDANGKIKANTTALNPGTGNDLGKVIVPPAIPATPTTPAVDYSGRLMTAGDIASAINHSGFVLTTDNTGGGTNTGKSDELINPGKKVTIDAGKNIDIKQEGSKVTVATKDEVAFKQVTIGDAGNNTVLTSTADGLDVGGDKITNVAAGTKDSDAVNVKQLKAAKTEVKAGTNIASVDKTQANDGHDIYTVNAKGTTVSGAGDVIVTATNTGGNVTNYEVSLSGGVKQDIGKGVQAYDIVTTQGIRFGGDTGVTNVHKLGDTMMIMGDQNVKTAADVDGIHMRLNPDVNVDSVTTGDTKMNDEGVTIKNGPALTKQGINAGNLPVRNVAPGRIAPDSRDAVNGAQLHALGRYVDNVDKRAKAGTASAIATAGLPQAYRPGASMVAAAGGYYDGQSAVAIGVSTISDNGRWVIKGAANVNSKEAGATIGIGYQW